MAGKISEKPFKNTKMLYSNNVIFKIKIINNVIKLTKNNSIRANLDFNLYTIKGITITKIRKIANNKINKTSLALVKNVSDSKYDLRISLFLS